MREENKEKDQLTHIAMEIILNAGDARNQASKAIQSALKGELKEADELLKSAKECVRLAHLAQTKVIQEEASGRVFHPTLLFIHAQDTLMTINSELMFSENLIQLYKTVCEKIG